MEGACQGRVPDPPYPAESLIPEYPASWPRPVFDRQADEQFLRSSGESMPNAVLSMLLDEQEQALVADLQGDHRLHLSLRADGPRREVCTYVTDQWVHAGLWQAFEPLGARKPYRPEPGTPCAVHFLLVQLDAFDADTHALEPVFFEPYSATFWQTRDMHLLRLQPERSSSAFPAISVLPAEGLQLASGAVATRVQPGGWCRARIRGPR